MKSGPSIAVSAIISGTVASLVSSAALAGLAKAEGKRAVQPLNATSHWLHGEQAGQTRQADIAHTAIGYATHHGASIFWACLFELMRARRIQPSAADVVKDAMIVAAIAAAVDYGVMPKRVTPGWEEVLSTTSMVGGFLAMATGLTLGGLLTPDPDPAPRAWRARSTLRLAARR